MDPISAIEHRIGVTELVTLFALAVTLIAGTLAFYYKSRLTQLQKDQIESLRLTVAEAQSQSDNAKAEASVALAKAEEARLKQTQVEQTNLQLKIELERLRLATRDRQLPANGLAMARDILKTFPKVHIAICSDMADAESVQFGRQIVQLCQSAGWRVDEFTSKFHPPIAGLHLLIKDESQVDVALAIFNAFREMGFSLSWEQKPDLDIPLQVWIGRKEFKE